MSIACGHCKGRHETVGAVRECSLASRTDSAPPVASTGPSKAPSESFNPTVIPVGSRGWGYFAVPLDGSTHFFRVDRPQKGKWKGYTFLKEQASDALYPVKGERAKKVLHAIAADIEGATVLYATEIGRCSRCNRTLTDDVSRARGMGPECAGKVGA